MNPRTVACYLTQLDNMDYIGSFNLIENSIERGILTEGMADQIALLRGEGRSVFEVFLVTIRNHSQLHRNQLCSKLSFTHNPSLLLCRTHL